ncbi:MAG TPA: chromosome segregation protein SMC, partial [Gammaproteobacteria bacterium]|nr:chromosome segregation protein SMC [Gammaproteobacteria bacterium]
MRLSKIKLAGFKSFVDPTTVPLSSNMVGVVGPNGCGKSNIIDAVRWVMGESSAKHLRGDSMADVIFNGSSARKPVGQASIELVFDNSDGTLGGQYANYNEIAVKRLVSRDGQSVYYLNGTRCRRRDITDIFLGTGLGPRSYAIIEQGTISRLIEAKPDELRVFLEEAAGISKYKERRRETENRIKHTRENLERLEDLREELDKQLNHLQRQARTAERYKELKEEERLKKGQLQALRWRGLDGEVAEREQAIHERETALEAERARQRSAEAEIERKREEQHEATEAFNTIQSEYYGVGAEIARLEQSIQHAKERRQQQQQDLDQVEHAWNEAQAHLEADRERVEKLKTELAELEPEQTRLAEAEEHSAAALAQAEEAMQDWQARWEAFNQEAAEPAQHAQVERTRLEQLEQRGVQYRQRLERLEEERGSVDAGGLEQEIADLERRRDEAEARRTALQEQLDACLERIRGQRQAIDADGEELERLRGRLHDRRGRRSSLEQLQHNALGQHEGAVSEWLSQRGLDQARRLAQTLEVDPGWERAVETVLGFHLEAVCVDGLDPLVGGLGELEHGSLALFDTAGARGGWAGQNGAPLRDKVRAPWPLDGLLAGVYAAEDMEAALALRPRLAAGESVVTPEGVWLGPAWLQVARDADEHAGVLQREQDLREVTEEVERLEQRVGEVEARVESGREELHRLEEERESLQGQVNEAGRAHGEVQSQLSGRQARLEQVRQRAERLEAEAEEVRRHLEESEQEVETSRNRLQEAVGRMEELERQRETFESERESLKDALDRAREQARNDRDAAQQVTMRMQTVRTELGSTEQALERARNQLDQMAERRERLREELSGADEPLERMRTELEELLAKRAEVENRLGDARRRSEEIDHELRELERARSGAEQAVQEAHGAMDELRKAWQELKVRRQTLQEQVAEAGYSLEALLEEMPEGADPETWAQ